MPNDGYTLENKSFEYYSSNQIKINNRIRELGKEMKELPTLSVSLDEWINSLPDLKSKKFGMDTFTKNCEIKKEYYYLLDKADTNLREMKILSIDVLLNKINNILNKRD